MNWDDLRVFLAVARGETLSAAGTVLKCDPATVGRRVARLERDAGTRLFVKSPQGYDLTESGTDLLSHAEAIELSVAQGLDDVGNTAAGGLSGQVRIGATDGCASYILPKVCAGLSQAHPNLDLQIVALPRLVNLSKREADMAISVSPPQAGQVSHEKICDYHLHLAASRDYLAGAPEIKKVSDLKDHPVIGYIPDMIYFTELDFLKEIATTRVNLASNLVSVQLGFLRANGGIGITHDFILPTAPDITPVLVEEVAFTRSFYLLRHTGDAKVERLALVADALRTGIAREIQHLEYIA